MANYAVNNLLAGSQQNLSTTYKTLVEIHAVTATLKRAALYEFEVGIDGSPNATDCSLDWDISRTTAAGTSTAATPNPLDPADAASGIVAAVNFTAEPTVTAASSLFSLGANQRASYRWIARDDKSALWIPATNLAGLAMRAKSATYASTAVAHAYYQDQ
jgi:hypothetical protein